MGSDERLAQIAYEAYGDAMGWRTVADDPMPRWIAVPHWARAGWIAASDAVLADANRDLRAALRMTAIQRDAAWKRLFWHPISTAPRDRRILLARTQPVYDRGAGGPFAWICAGSWSAKHKRWWDGVEPCGLRAPTHWQELPQQQDVIEEGVNDD